MRTAIEITTMILLGVLLGALAAGWPFYPL